MQTGNTLAMSPSSSPPRRSGWPRPTPFPQLAPGQVHCWRADLALPPSELDRLYSLLSPRERAQADRLRSPLHRSRWLAGHGLLRELSGHYLGQDPAGLVYRYGDHGKPYLVSAPELCFNLTDSHGLALCAFSLRRELGVDLERVRTGRDNMPLAYRVYSPTEVGTLAALPEPARTQAFFVYWTRREAHLKALGTGLSGPDRLLDFSCVPLPDFATGRPAPKPLFPGWFLVDLDPAPGFAGALVVEGTGWELACWEWTPRLG